MQNVILPSWIFGMGVHCDIFTTLTLAGFIFWVIAQLDVYSGVSMRTMKVLFQQCCNYGKIWEYILSQFTVELTGIIGIENRNREHGWICCHENVSLQLKSLIPQCVKHWSTLILLWSSLRCQNFPNSDICFIQPTTAIISAGIICWLAMIIYNPFIQRGYTNAYLFPRIKSL